MAPVGAGRFSQTCDCQREAQGEGGAGAESAVCVSGPQYALARRATHRVQGRAVDHTIRHPLWSAV